MKITKIDRKVANTLAMELYMAAGKIAERYGLKAVQKSGSFDAMRHTAKVEFVVTETAEGKSTDQVEFEQYCHWHGLKPEHFGKEIVLQGAKFKISGLKTKASKNTICITRVSDGKGFVTSDELVREKLGIKGNPMGFELPEVN
jgi:hypothetical protein